METCRTASDAAGPGQPRLGYRAGRARNRSGRNVALIATAALAMGACSGGGGSEVPTAISGPSSGLDVSVDTGPDFVPTPDAGSDGAAVSTPATTQFDLAAQPSTPAIDPIPETGVPGIDSSDAFCRGWSEFAGTFQALALVSAVGNPDGATRLEVIAASSVTAAVEAMQANLPDELEAERVALIVDFAGPFVGRALLAEADLLAAGLDPDSLRDLWLATLTEAGVDDPAIVVVVPDGIDGAALDAAVTSFAAAQPSIVSDPKLITDAAIPATGAYLAASCPDGGILSGNDVID